MVDLSIIIPTHNCMSEKRNSLELVLNSIKNQNIDKNKIEIIFIDNCSKDDTIPFIEKWIKINNENFGAAQLCFNQEILNRSKTRNIGVEKANGERILFMDDDTVIYDKNTLEKLIRKFYEKNTFFCGAQRYWTLAGWNFENLKLRLTKNENIETYAFLPKGISRESGYRDLQEFSFIGNFGGLMKEDFNKIGGFDSLRFPSRREDVDLMYRLLLNNFSFKLLYNWVKVIHLTHPIIGNKQDERLYWHKEFRKKEHEEGYYFCVNHLFQVFEDNNETHPVLKRII